MPFVPKTSVRTLCVSVFLPTLMLLASQASAQTRVITTKTSTTEDLGPVGVKIDSNVVDFGRLHLVLHPMVANLSRQSLLGAAASAYLQLSDSLTVRGHAAIPYYGLDNGPDATRWFRLEGAVSFLRTSDELESEEVILEYDQQTKTYRYPRSTVKTTTTHKKAVSVPALNRNSRGFGGGLLARSGVASVEIDGRDRETHGVHFTPFVGINALNAMGLAVDVDGFGKFSSNRWLAGGLDLMYDLYRRYDADPDESPGRFGFRLWTETIFGKAYGMAGRLEMGYLPGGTGMYLLAGVGIGTNGIPF